eukprot:COSAG02_NODE_718_length_18064_cov_5.507932_5_plen_339_part_00
MNRYYSHHILNSSYFIRHHGSDIFSTTTPQQQRCAIAYCGAAAAFHRAPHIFTTLASPLLTAVRRQPSIAHHTSPPSSAFLPLRHTIIVLKSHWEMRANSDSNVRRTRVLPGFAIREPGSGRGRGTAYTKIRDNVLHRGSSAQVERCPRGRGRGRAPASLARACMPTNEAEYVATPTVRSTYRTVRTYVSCRRSRSHAASTSAPSGRIYRSERAAGASVRTDPSDGSWWPHGDGRGSGRPVNAKARAGDGHPPTQRMASGWAGCRGPGCSDRVCAAVPEQRMVGRTLVLDSQLIEHSDLLHWYVWLMRLCNALVALIQVTSACRRQTRLDGADVGGRR